MSIASEITRINTNIANAYTQCNNKGATMPQVQNSNNLANTIASITGGGGKEVITWHQCNTTVNDYIENVDYTNVPYTQSSIDDYAPASPTMQDWATYQTPVGKTVDGVTYYNEIPNKQTPFASTNVAGTLTPLDQLRWLNVSYLPRNVRDLGGWSCDGGTVKYGKLFRGSELKSASESIPASKITMMKQECGIRAEMDLRGGDIDFNVSPLGDDVRFKHIDGADTYYINYSSIFLPSNRDAVVQTLRFIFDNVVYGTPLYFHCTTGADRTGTVALLIEGLLGVSQSDCDKDYELTSFNVNRKRTDSRWTTLISDIQALNGTTFRDKFVTLFAMFGFTKDEINLFRRAMIDGTPEEVTPSIDNCTITKTLEHATIDNSASTIYQYQPYVATITPDSGYTLEGATYTIQMGGVDASQYYRNGVINIPFVTGNIVISVSAVPSTPQYTNQVPISTDSSGNIYNGVGYKDDYRLNSSYSESSASGSAVTGFIPFDKTKTLRIKGITINDTTAMYVEFFNSSKTGQYWVNAKISGVSQISNAVKFKQVSPVTDSHGNIVVWDGANQNNGNEWITLANGNELDNTAYVRISGTCNGANMIVTINEDIV